MNNESNNPNMIINEVGDLGLGLYPISEDDQDKIKKEKTKKEIKEGN